MAILYIGWAWSAPTCAAIKYGVTKHSSPDHRFKAVSACNPFRRRLRFMQSASFSFDNVGQALRLESTAKSIARERLPHLDPHGRLPMTGALPAVRTDVPSGEWIAHHQLYNGIFIAFSLLVLAARQLHGSGCSALDWSHVEARVLDAAMSNHMGEFSMHDWELDL